MSSKITPHLIELTYEATLKSFWRKIALRKFLRASKISEAFLSTWVDDESKREFLDRLFEKLIANDKGQRAIYRIAKSLSEKSTFPDLDNWEESEKMISDARRSVSELKLFMVKQSKEIQKEKEIKNRQKAARELREKIQKSKTDLSKLQNKLNTMSTNIGTQVGGYSFEKWFYDFLDYYGIKNKRPYINQGRQIDGALTLEGTTYLVELKFTKDQIGVSVVDSLKAKINKMADNTMGIIVSMSGFSSNAIKDASGSRTPLMIFDHSHLYLALTGVMSFPDILSRVRRHVSQTGEALLKVDEFGK